MVWGEFGGGRTGVLYRIEGIITKDVYLKILLKVAILDAIRLCGMVFVFQQDNNPKHTAIVVQKRKVLKVMTWPPQSPDLNPIELRWAKLEWPSKLANFSDIS